LIKSSVSGRYIINLNLVGPFNIHVLDISCTYLEESHTGDKNINKYFLIYFLQNILSLPSNHF